MKLPVAGFATAAALFVVDQAAKYGITDVLKLNFLSDAYHVTSFFNLRFVANQGVSLGLLHADTATMRWLLVAMTGAIALGVLVWLLREKNRADQMALGLVLGGAAGNIVDRIRLGYVVDWADFHIGAWQPFLVFNGADAAITIGVLILLARALLVRDKPTGDSGTHSGAEQGPTENIHA
ncbi:MAG: signal peptidase II [Pseudomonadota bacterium]|jgi:signal peptidase II|uniref:Lipoprotein signal peptidase n=3 Tax=Pseudomonadota TaxID=1224 RepID=A0ABU4PHV7_9SPHN|nr:signal peptidase II [Sphingomonas echinoides]MDX5983780.1 signal peptidase II [Sphingomonas echinoides]